MKTILTKLILVLPLVLSLGVANAAPAEPLLDEEVVKETFKSELWKKLDTGPDGNLLGDESAVVFQVYEESKTFNVKYALPQRVSPAQKDGDSHRILAYNILAQVPVDTDSGGAPLPTLDGLSDAYTVGFSFTYSAIPVNNGFFQALANDPTTWSEARDRLAEKLKAGGDLSEACTRQLEGSLPGFTGTELSAAHGSTLHWKSIAELTDMTLWEAVTYTAVDYQPAADSPAFQNIRRIYSDPAAAISPSYSLLEQCDKVDTALASWTGGNWSRSFGLSGEVGRETFDYRNPTDLMSLDSDEDVYSVKTFASFFKGGTGSDVAMTFAYEYQQSYEEADEQTICINDGAIPDEDCATARFAAPMEQKKSILSAEGRARFDTLGFGRPMALQFKASYDFETEEHGFDMPIYLFSFNDNELNAGFRVGWQSETDEVDVGFFYGQKF